MEESSRRSVERSGIVLKKRSSSGCLIVRKKGDGVGGAGGVGPSQRKRPRMIMSDSGSSDERSLARPRRLPVGAETIRVCSGLAAPRKGVSGLSVGVGRNGEENRKRSRLDVFEFNEYDGIDGEGMGGRQFDDGGIEPSRRRLLGSPPMARSGGSRDFASGSSRQTVAERRRNMCINETSGGFSREDGGSKNRFQMKREGGRIPIQMLREKYGGRPDEAIRVQGKNGVLRVLVNPKKKIGGPVRNLDPWDEHRKVPVGEGRKRSIPEDITHNVTSHPTAFADIRRNEMRNPPLKIEKNKLNVQKPVSAKINKPDEWEKGDSDMSPTPSRRNADIRDSVTRVSCKKEKSPQSKIGRDREKSPQLKIGRRKGKPRQAKMSHEKEKSPQPKIVARAKSPETPVPAGPKEAKVKRGSGTEKQKLRERIREMLLNAGWTIDYRPRRNRDYLDAVYINPAGTAYWSIIKAYDALQKQLDDDNDNDEEKASGVRSAFVISDETLGQLTRKTQKKMEKEMRMKEREGAGSANTRQVAIRRNSKPKHEEESMDSDSEEEKLSSFIKQGGKSSKKGPVHHLHSSTDKGTSDSNIHQVHGRKGRCTLLVRSSDKGLNSERDGFVLYTGKRTLLSWLIDSGVVELSQKVQYMNRRKTRVLLEGWVTRDGIHCGCCSKILTLSKFEIHAGSKLRQPFQNIHLESGVSLLQCQNDAWNRQEESKREGYHTVDAEGDDPNDDTCGLCGDGGDLICCDGCPSTFHQSCLNIQKLPPGDWHCPNCTCKYCGVASGCTSHVDNATASEIFACELCEKKYHKSCLEKTDTFPWDSSSTVHSFCSQKCAELFKHLQKYLGAKHEVEGGFSWSLIRRTVAESDMSLQGLPQRVECNSKLAVALTIMDECFLPIVDRRSGINMIHNVLYNCGSNFNRINYSGFYTAILERGDEIISAASLRFHGTQLAEMPFIGTRHIYRRQGMCRRLFSAIELALRSLKVEVLIIPAISELMHTWTVAFGFSPLKESLKQDMRSLNMLVFPGLDMLQKLLLEQDTVAGSRDAKPMELEMGKQVATPESDDISEHDDPGDSPGKEGNKADIMDCDPKSQDVSLGNTSTGNGSSHDASDDVELQVSSERLEDSDSDLADKSPESDVDHICSAPCNAEIEACKVEDDSVPGLPSQVGVQSTTEDGYTDDSPETEAGVACKKCASKLEGINGTPHTASVGDSCATYGNQMHPLLSGVSHNKSGMDDKSMSDLCVAGDFQNSDCLINANEEQRDISTENVIVGADVKSGDAPSIHQSKENLVLVNSNADDQISNGKENAIEFNDDEELFSHTDVEIENKSLLSFPSEGESLNETYWGSCSGRSHYDSADADVKVTIVEPLVTSEEKQESIEIWKEENAEDAPVSNVVPIQALEEAEDFREDITMEENRQDASVSDVN